MPASNNVTDQVSMTALRRPSLLTISRRADDHSTWRNANDVFVMSFVLTIYDNNAMPNAYSAKRRARRDDNKATAAINNRYLTYRIR